MLENDSVGATILFQALKAAEGSIKETKEEHRKMVQERQRQREKVAQRYLTIQRLFLRDGTCERGLIMITRHHKHQHVLQISMNLHLN